MDVQVLETVILVVHVLAALAIIGLVLIQHGKGADMGSGFGSGASATVFGSGGAGNFLTRTTTTLAIVFFLTSFGLAYFAKQQASSARIEGIPSITNIAPADTESQGRLDVSDDSELPALDMDSAEPATSELPAIEIPAAGDDNSSPADNG